MEKNYAHKVNFPLQLEIARDVKMIEILNNESTLENIEVFKKQEEVSQNNDNIIKKMAHEAEVARNKRLKLANDFNKRSITMDDIDGPEDEEKRDEEKKFI